MSSLQLQRDDHYKYECTQPVRKIWGSRSEMDAKCHFLHIFVDERQDTEEIEKIH